MDTKTYKTHLKLTLDPIWYPGHEPHTMVQFNNKTIFEGAFTKTQMIEYEEDLEEGEYTIHVIFSNKSDDDTKMDQNLDKAIIVRSLQINGVSCDAGLLHSIYYPADREEMSGMNYISWNGIWTLKIAVPAFTWIHKIKNLGWIFR